MLIFVNLMNRLSLLLAALLMASACGSRYPDHSVIVNSDDALVQTAAGTVCGYIEDGIYTFKGIDYAQARRFEAPQDPEPWQGVQTALYYGNQCHQAPRFTWGDDAEAFLYQWDDGVQSDNCLNLNVWTKGINDGKKRPVMVWLHGGIIESGSMTTLMEPEKARAMGRKVAEKLGLDASTIDKIQEIPYSELLAAATDAVIEENPENVFYRWYGAGMWCSPVLDGEVIPYPLDDPRVADISKGLPTIIGCNFSENNMLPAVYANADMRYKMGDTKQYLYIFAKPSPHMDGTFATNHCTEMPFVFNNIWLGRFMVGADRSAYKLADFMSDVWVSFARDGVPDVKRFHWEEYHPDTRPMVVFNDQTVTVHAGDPLFSDMAAYKPARWKYRQQ